MFWIDRTSETDNVIVIDDSTILIGSCDEESYDSVDQQFKANKTPMEVLGSDDLSSIPYAQIQRIVSRSTDNDVGVSYKAKKEIEQKDLYFGDVEAKQEFVTALDRMLPDHLVKAEFKQSAIAAAFNPMISLALSLFAVYLFMNKFRWVAIIVGGLWALVSLYMLVSRIKSPPVVTRWTIGGRYVRKVWGGIKTAVSYVILAAAIAVGYDALPDAYGPKSLYEQMEYETLSPTSVQTLLDRGADINYQDEYGDTALSLALDWGEYDIAEALIEAGADLSLKSSYEMTPIEYAVSYDVDMNVIEAMLRNGASLDFEVDGMTPMEYAKEYENVELVTLLAERGGR
ncbi:MAG: ankyrin repeat domain-containing protein [Woeseiaceae bacterium]